MSRSWTNDKNNYFQRTQIAGNVVCVQKGSESATCRSVRCAHTVGKTAARPLIIALYVPFIGFLSFSCVGVPYFLKISHYSVFFSPFIPMFSRFHFFTYVSRFLPDVFRIYLMFLQEKWSEDSASHFLITRRSSWLQQPETWCSTSTTEWRFSRVTKSKCRHSESPRTLRPLSVRPRELEERTTLWRLRFWPEDVEKDVSRLVFKEEFKLCSRELKKLFQWWMCMFQTRRGAAEGWYDDWSQLDHQADRPPWKEVRRGK